MEKEGVTHAKEVYEPEFKKKIVQMYLEEGRTIKGLNEEYQLRDGTVRK